MRFPTGASHDGDIRARQFDALVRPEIPSLYASAYRLLGNRADAEDLVQEVLIKLYPRTSELLDLRAARPWLLKVLYRQFIDFTRQRSRQPRTVDDEELIAAVPDQTAGPAQQAADADIAARVVAALAQLPPDHRAVVVLHMIDGHTMEELTTVFDVPLGTIKSRLHRAKATLKRSLGVEAGEWNLSP
jgi:RNA polymerase sigma-70 factor (ECF subfamily)